MSDADLLQEIRENRSYASQEWDAINEEAKKDRMCVAGKPWEALDPDAVKERRAAKRPYLALDELGQYINQTVNDVRANPRAIKFAPTGNGANDKGAELYQNHTREIEYRSSARVGYARAFEDAVTSSVGWIKVSTKREHIRTFNQDLWIDPIVNPGQVLADPNAVWPDSRDVKFLYYIEPWARSAFKRKWPRAKGVNFSAEVQRESPGWGDSKTIHVSEYWRIESVSRQLVAFRHPQTQEIFQALVHELPGGKLPDGVENLREESVDDTKVVGQVTNGVELLGDPIPWVGKYIPFVSCFGKVIYVDEGAGSKRQILSMTRLARDPYMLYCYLRTCEAEAIGGIPRAQWVGYEGQFAKPKIWQQSLREPVAFMEAKAQVPGMASQTPLPLPVKQSWDPPLQNLEVAAEAIRRAIQAAMGITPNPTPQAQNNQVSGVAKEKFDSSAQRGSFHFVDNYELMIERVGVIIEDLFDKVLDTKRSIPVRKPDDGADSVNINDPNDPDSVSTKGDYRVTVSTGPATESQRQEGADFVDTLVTNINVIAEIAGPQKATQLLAKSIKLKQLGPIGDELVDLLAPPAMGKDGKPLTPEMQSLMQEVKSLQAQLQQAQQEKQGKVIETQGKIAVQQKKNEGDLAKVQIQASSTSDDKQADREVKLAVAAIEAHTDQQALLLEESKLVGARADQHATMTHEHNQAARQRLHERTENVKDRLHEHIQGTLDHSRVLEAGQVAHENALEQQDQAPEPPAAGE